VVSDGTRSFTYDDRGRMTGATAPGPVTLSFAINGLGQRVLKQTNQFAYDEAGRFIAEFEWTGSLRNETVYLGSIPVVFMTRSAQEVIVDDATAGQTTIVGTWSGETVDPGYHGGGYRKKAAGSGSASFTWTPAVTGSQSYLVYARWTASSDRATNAPCSSRRSRVRIPVKPGHRSAFRCMPAGGDAGRAIVIQQPASFRTVIGQQPSRGQ
jgi:hypothetical protein